MPTRVFSRIVDQHLDECSFLLAARPLLTSCPLRGFSHLQKHDARISSHLDGLRLDPNEGWRAACASMEESVAGAMIPATILAIESGKADRLDTVLAETLGGTEAIRGFLAGCAWTSYRQVVTTVQRLSSSEDALFAHLAIAVAGLHRQDPGPKLTEAIASADPNIRARAWRIAGWVRRRDVLGSAWKAYSDENPDVRFAAGCTGPLLGDLNGISVLQELSVSEWTGRERAARLAALALELSSVRVWHARLAGAPALARVAVAVAGASGDPALIPWLLEIMKHPDLARTAGHAFASITGASIVGDGLEGAPAEGVDMGPNDEPTDDNVELDPDGFLPWPDPVKTGAWWSARGSQFQVDARYILGRLASPEALKYALIHGSQRIRSEAAWSAAFRSDHQSVFETRAPADRQAELLGVASLP